MNRFGHIAKGMCLCISIYIQMHVLSLNQLLLYYAESELLVPNGCSSLFVAVYGQLWKGKASAQTQQVSSFSFLFCFFKGVSSFLVCAWSALVQ